MNKRPLLEIASWIAGIISMAIAVYALFPSHSAKPQGSERVSSAVTPPASAGAHQNRAEAPLSPNDSSLAQAVESAMSISSWQSRDDALFDIARVAIEKKRFEQALAATKRINAWKRRDFLLEAISCYAAREGSLTVARDAAILLNDYRVKDSKLAQIASVAVSAGTTTLECNAL